MKNKARLLAVPYIIWMALFIIAPIIIVIIYAFRNTSGELTLSNFAGMKDYLPVFLRSFYLAVIATAFCLLLSYPLAYILAHTRKRSQKLALMLIILPMWMNFLLRTYAWMSILENTGLLNRFLSFLGLGTISMINTQPAIVLGMVYNFLPFMVLPIYSVIIKIDRSLIEAAQDLGAHPAQVFSRVIFPISLPGVLSGVTMVFVPSVSTFIISQLLGGGKFMLLGDLIESQFLGAAYNPYLGSAISLVMMIIVTFCIWLMNKFGDGEGQAVML